MTNNIHPIFDQLVSRSERESLLDQKAHVFWLTGLSGSGKSTIAKTVERSLHNQGYLIKVLDGDNIRSGICQNLGFSIEDRNENIRRIAEVARLFLDCGVITLCSFISPTNEIRNMAREIIGSADFSEIYVQASLDECKARDVKGLYAKVERGEIKGFTGVDSPYEVPRSPTLSLNTEKESVEQSSETLIRMILKKVKKQQ